MLDSAIHLAPVVQTLHSIIYQVDKNTETNSVIHWTKIYPVDSVIQLLNNWSLVNHYQGRIQVFFLGGGALVHSSLALLQQGHLRGGGGGAARTPCILPLDLPLTIQPVSIWETDDIIHWIAFYLRVVVSSFDRQGPVLLVLVLVLIMSVLILSRTCDMAQAKAIKIWHLSPIPPFSASSVFILWCQYSSAKLLCFCACFCKIMLVFIFMFESLYSFSKSFKAFMLCIKLLAPLALLVNNYWMVFCDIQNNQG